MKKWILLAALALPVTAHAQAEFFDGQPLRGNLNATAIGGMTATDSVGHMIRVDENGNVWYLDASPDRAQVYFKHAIAQTILQTPARTGAGATSKKYPAADSSAVLNIQGWKHMGLMFTYSQDDSVYSYAIALQVRVHSVALQDSISRYPWGASWKSGGGNPDSAGSFGTAAALLPTSNVGYDSLATTNERVVLLENCPGSSGTKFVLLDDVGGGFPSGTFLSIRVRYLNAFGTTAIRAYGDSNNNGGTTADPFLTLSADLVGWR